jgi:putative DNA primase/helicase
LAPGFTPTAAATPAKRTKADRPGFPTVYAAAAWALKKHQAVSTTGWFYHNPIGEEVYAVIRLNFADGSKSYKPVHRGTNGGWRFGDPRGLLPLYHLPELTRPGQIIVCEGEKAADVARTLAGIGTTSAHGSKSAAKSDWGPLAGRDVVIVPDNDAPGAAYANAVGAILTRLNPPANVRILDLATIWTAPEPLVDGADLVDWVQHQTTTQHTDVQFVNAVINAPAWSPPAGHNTSGPKAGTGPSDDSGWPLTELGNANRFLYHHGTDVRHCHLWGKWLIWDGKRWDVDVTGKALDLASENANTILFDLDHATGDKDERKRIIEWWRSSQGRRRCESTLALAATKGDTPVRPDQFDADPWLLNVANGTIDLRTGTLRPHTRADLLTKICPWEYHPDAECPLWVAVMNKFFARPDEADRDDLISYFQRLAGYALTGVIREHVLPVAFGTGSNGKSTILGTLQAMLGDDYACPAPRSLLLAKAHDSHPTEVAKLHQKRLVLAIETEQGRRFDEALVKELTGGDKLSARRMREDFWEFNPTHKIILCTNHKPAVRGTDHGIWRRLQLIPFTVTIKDGEADRTVPDKLKAEMPGILAWCVRGCLQWQEIGLEPPPEIAEATQEYRSDQDKLGAFIEENTLQGPDYRVRAGELYDRYKLWCEATGEHQMSMTAFGNSINERGFQRQKTMTGRFIIGLAVPQ